MIECRSAQPDDLPTIADIFFAAFEDSVRHAAAAAASVRAIEGLLGVARAAEPGCLMVAERAGQIVGYVLASADMRRLRWTALWQGKWLCLLGRWLTGRYGVGWRTLRMVVADKIAFRRGARLGPVYRARLLSLGVHPAHQRQGVGRQLVAAGLEYLRSKGVKQIRLEVRPENAPARHLYEEFGFQPGGEYRDSQGRWLIMTKEGWEDSDG